MNLAFMTPIFVITSEYDSVNLNNYVSLDKESSVTSIYLLYILFSDIGADRTSFSGF